MECAETERQIDDFCDAWQADYLEITEHEQSDGNQHNFFIKFQVEFNYPSFLPLEDEKDYLLVEFDLASSTSFHHFWAHCKRSNHENLSWDDISTMLTKIRVPLHKQPFMLHRIYARADEIANARNNKNLNILPMMVSISIRADYFSYDQQDSTTLVMRENSDVVKLMALPASKGAIEGLLMKIVEDQEKGSIKKCMICLEKLGFGSQITGMPCSHEYHQECILRWLKITNFCPFCRFKLNSA